MNDDNNALVSTPVPEAARMTFLPSMFGTRNMLRGESLVYDWMRRLSEDYAGGHWTFHRVSNGAMYTAPNRAVSMRIAVDGNGFAGTMSADAAGIVATLFALNHLAGLTEEERHVDLYYLLRDYGSEHPEREAIFQATD